MNNCITILIVEDEEIWIQNLKFILEDLGYVIAGVARRVEDALEMFADIEYDIVLMDINLNGKNSGIELGKMISQVYKKPLIFITANEGHHLKAAEEACPSAYLPKPLNISSLYFAIQNAINNFSNNSSTPLPQKDPETLYSFFVKQGNKYKKINWNDVVYLTAGKNYIGIFNASDKTEYHIRGSLQKTLQHIIPSLMQKSFVQINRSEVIQLSFILEVTADEIKTAYGTFSVTDGFAKDLKSRLNIVS